MAYDYNDNIVAAYQCVSCGHPLDDYDWVGAAASIIWKHTHTPCLAKRLMGTWHSGRLTDPPPPHSDPGL